MYQDKLQIVEESDFIYLIVHRKTQNILAGNKLAKIFYSQDIDGNFFNLKEIFAKEIENITQMLEGLHKIKYVKLLDLKSKKNNGSLFECDVEFRFLDEENDIIYIIVKEKTNNDNLIKRCIELSKTVELDQQYFEVMQEYTKDLFFRIDIKNKTMVHRGDISSFYGLIPVIENYPESMRENGLIHPDDLDGYMEFAYNLMKGIAGVYETRVQFNDRSYEWYKLQGKALCDSDGKAIQMIGKSENIQKLVNVREHSSKDVLATSLNKEAFEVMVEAKLEFSSDTDRYALVLVDFDDFKLANERHGNIYGDFIVETASKRINNCIRQSDKVGRVGVDQFAVMFNYSSDKEIIVERAEVIQKSLSREYNNGEHNYNIKTSVGISFFPEDGRSYDELYDKSRKELENSRKK